MKLDEYRWTTNWFASNNSIVHEIKKTHNDDENKIKLKKKLKSAYSRKTQKSDRFEFTLNFCLDERNIVRKKLNMC